MAEVRLAMEGSAGAGLRATTGVGLFVTWFALMGFSKLVVVVVVVVVDEVEAAGRSALARSPEVLPRESRGCAASKGFEVRWPIASLSLLRGLNFATISLLWANRVIEGSKSITLIDEDIGDIMLLAEPSWPSGLAIAGAVKTLIGFKACELP